MCRPRAGDFRDPGPRRAGSQPQEHRRRPSSRPARRLDGCQRVGEKLAGFRHDLRRRASDGFWNAFPASAGGFSTSSSGPTSTRSRACRRPIAIEQRAGTANPRSTLGTVTEIHDYLRLLYARAGTPHCPTCGVPIHCQTPEQMVDQFLRLNEGRKVQILAPLVRGRKGQHGDVFQAIRRAGLIRARVDGEMIEVTDNAAETGRRRRRTRSRRSSIGWRFARASARVSRKASTSHSSSPAAESSHFWIRRSGWEEQFLSVRLNCPQCGMSLPAIDPRSFSFNSPHGACPACEGLGSRVVVPPGLVVPDRARSWESGAALPWSLLVSEGRVSEPDEALVREFSGSSTASTLARRSRRGRARSGRHSGRESPTAGFPDLAALLERFFEDSPNESLRKCSGRLPGRGRLALPVEGRG